MKPLPHRYVVTVTGGEAAPAEVTSCGLPMMHSAPPSEFGGPGNLWSPETLLVAAVADCFVITFRAIAKASNFQWTQLVCSGTGTVDRSDRLTCFTEVKLHAQLKLPSGADTERAKRVLEKAEKTCVIGNSLRFPPTLTVEITIEKPVLAPPEYRWGPG